MLRQRYTSCPMVEAYQELGGSLKYALRSSIRTSTRHRTSTASDSGRLSRRMETQWIHHLLTTSHCLEQRRRDTSSVKVSPYRWATGKEVVVKHRARIRAMMRDITTLRKQLS